MHLSSAHSTYAGQIFTYCLDYSVHQSLLEQLVQHIVVINSERMTIIIVKALEGCFRGCLSYDL